METPIAQAGGAIFKATEFGVYQDNKTRNGQGIKPVSSGARTHIQDPPSAQGGSLPFPTATAPGA